MSAGLKFISCALAAGTGTAITKLDRSLLVGDEENAVFDFVVGYYRRYREVPDTTLVREHTGVRLPRANGNVAFHLESLQDRYDYELIRVSWEGIRSAVQAGDPKPVIARMEETIRSVRRRPDNALIDAYQGMQLVIDRLEGIRPYGGISGIPTPWPKLNNATGGYQKSDLITYVGRSSMGKTSMLIAQAEKAYEEGYSALIVTTEMGSEQIVRRWMALRFNLAPEPLKLGTVSNYLMRRIREYQQELLGRERFRLLSIGMRSDVSTVFRAVEEMQPDIVLLDGVYLLRPSRQGGRMNRIERVTEVIDEVKQGTIDTNIPWVISTQFNRQAGKKGKEGDLENIGLSDAIAWNSSLVIAVKPGPTENPDESRELDVLKGREGENLSFAINYKFRPVNFTELTEDELEAAGLNRMNLEDWQ